MGTRNMGRGRVYTCRMIDLSKARLPQSVKVGGSFYRIHTDFKYFLRMRELLTTKPADIADFDFMYIDVPHDRSAGLDALLDFMNPQRLLPRSTGEETRELVLDYAIDAPYIYAAFMEQYGIDLIDARLHWYKFTALLHGLHDTELNRIIGARLYKPSGKESEYEKSRRKQYEAWRLPLPEDNTPDEALEDFLGQLKH